MKRQIFSLMLSAAIFTTSPLFGMETDLDKGILHKPCPLCTPKLMESADIDAGKGIFNIFPNDDLIIEVIPALPYNTVLALSQTSQIMNYYCQFPIIWERLAQKENIKLNPKFCIIDQVKEYYAPFGNINKKHTVTISELLSYRKDGYQPDKLLHYYCRFQLGKTVYQMTTFKDVDYLEFLNPNDQVTFPWVKHPSIDCMSSFTTSFPIIINPRDARNTVFGSEEYIELERRARNAREHISIWNTFLIRRVCYATELGSAVCTAKK